MTWTRLDSERCYRAVESRDARFDGWFITGVRTTGIYCRPSCPTPVRPKQVNVEFFPTPAAAQSAGFRACKRCRPDASPGSPEWDVRADLVGRAMRLIADGAIDRGGVGGLARTLAVSERHLNRLLASEVGAGPLALARAQRAQTARVLIETTALPMSSVAFGAGFASIRQFNDTIREVFALTPTDLRRTSAGRRGAEVAAPGQLTLRLPFRAPLDASALLAYLGARAVVGVEELVGDAYRRTLRLPSGPGVATLEPAVDHVRCTLRLTSLSDLAAAVSRCRRLLDLDADPVAVAGVLGADAALAPLVARRPGLRAPGAVDGAELAVRAVIGQQVSVAAARTVIGRLVERVGEPLPSGPDGGLTTLFPSPSALAALGPGELPMPAARAKALAGLCTELATGGLDLDAGADRGGAERALLALPGIGPWTAGYIALRALGDPDVFLAGDLGVRLAAGRLGLPERAGELVARAEGWRPWRTYATHHLWASLAPEHEEST